MFDLLAEAEGVLLQSPVHSPTLQRAAGVPTAELLRDLVTTVGDLSDAVAQSNVQQAQTPSISMRWRII